MEETKKTSKVRTHFKKHKGKYITGGICLAVGVVGGIILSKSSAIADNRITALGWKINVDATNINNINLTKRGHAGNVIRCLETGEMFASQNRAAEAMGISKKKLSEYLNGKRDNVDGFTFENLGEMPTSQN